LFIEHVLLLSEFSEPRVLYRLAGCDAIIRVVNEQLLDQIDNFRRGMRNKLQNASAVDLREIELHVGGVLLEIVQ